MCRFGAPNWVFFGLCRPKNDQGQRVEPHDSILSLTKIEAATRQTEAAIEAFVRGDFDIAITLAGAASANLSIALPFYREPSPIFAINCKGKNGLLG
jgi:hypothetical protein